MAAAKISPHGMEGLFYDGLGPPDEFIRMFRVQAIFQDWKPEDALKFLPAFLHGHATDVFDKLTAKTTLEDAIKGLVAGCGPKKDHYIQSFHMRKRKAGESMVKFGLAIKKLLNQGLPEVKGEAESQIVVHHKLECSLTLIILKCGWICWSQ